MGWSGCVTASSRGRQLGLVSCSLLSSYAIPSYTPQALYRTCFDAKLKKNAKATNEGNGKTAPDPTDWNIAAALPLTSSSAQSQA
jgi:hypothetical protein